MSTHCKREVTIIITRQQVYRIDIVPLIYCLETMADTLDISAVADAVASAVKMGPPPPALPQGWILKSSRSNPGYYYYYNMETGLTSWQPPMMDRQQLEQEEEEVVESLPPPSTPIEEKVEDPEVAPDRSSKRRKPASSSSGGPKEVRVLHILKKHKDSRRPSSWRQPKITQTLEEAKEELQGLLEILQEEEGTICYDCTVILMDHDLTYFFILFPAI